MDAKKGIGVVVLGAVVLIHSCWADRIVFTGQGQDDNWNNPTNWVYYKSNPPRTGVPAEMDEVRLNPGMVVRITTPVTVGYLKVGVYGLEKVIIDGGSLVTLGTSEYNSANYKYSGTIIVQNGGSATFNSRFMVGYGETSLGQGALEIRDGTVRVADVFFHNMNYSGTETLRSRTTIYGGGLLDVDKLTLNSGVMDIAGGTVVVRSDVVRDVERWLAEGRLIAMGGAEGWTVKATYNIETGWTTLVAAPPATVG